jgi:phosphoenolpyruvate carboxykinase (GTP)
MLIGFVWMKIRNFFGLDLVIYLNSCFVFVKTSYLIFNLGDNIRVLDWIIRRINNEDVAEISPVGLLPKKGSINLQGLVVDWDKLMNVPKDYWTADIEETLSWLDGQLGDDLPKEIRDQIELQKQRLTQLN